MTSQLQILLGDVAVGELSLEEDDVSVFRFLSAYRELPHRPVLGQAFEDDLGRVHRSRMALPPFFSNLLPEGRLRELLAERLEVSPAREFFLLARLGDDLPGAVRVVSAGPLEAEVGAPPPAPAPPVAQPLKFSLAGVQLKLSMVREGRGLTLPTSGQGGDWIAKLPGTHYRGVPENEFATMKWAALVGLETPQVDLVPVADLKGLPEGFAQPGDQALAVRRFDRPSGGARVHIEDFAQILGKYPAEKYRSTNYETIGRITLRVAGEESFAEFVRRLVFVIVSANADAHIKNWSLLYADQVHPRLSPAYDLVSTIEFIEPDALALNLGGTEDWNRLSLAQLDSFSKKVGADPLQVRGLATEVVRRALDAWPQVVRDYGASDLLQRRLLAHWSRVPLLSELR